MDQERERLQDDLRGLVVGEVRCDDITLQLYAADASPYQIRPLAVVCPRSLADVSTCVQYAEENNLPIHARGAGTGLAGESLGAGIVLDFSRFMHRIIETGDDDVRVQPGVTYTNLNQHLKKFGRQFSPDPANADVTTMGSVVAIDASGAHWLKYGSTRRYVKHLQIVLSDGVVIEVGREPLSRHPQDGPARRRQQLITELADLLLRNNSLIRRHQPQSDLNRSGYHLTDILSEGHLDLPKLLTGSEGTLALFTEITLKTVPLPKNVGALLLMFGSLEQAASAVQEIVPMGVSVCDLIDRRHLTLARESDVHYDLLIPQGAEAVLAVESESDNPQELQEHLEAIVARVRDTKKIAFDTKITLDRQEVSLFRQLAKKVIPRLYRLKGSSRPLPFIEDIAIPPDALPEFFITLQNALKKHQVIASLFAHAGHGQLHIRPFLDLANPADVQKMDQLAEDLYGEVIKIGGTISGEHGDGLSRTPFIERQYGPLYSVFREVKRIFDPHNVFNPDKIVTSKKLSATQHLRPVTTSLSEPETTATDDDQIDSATTETSQKSTTSLPILLPQLNWSVDELTLSARACNGCGACRSRSDDVRMCPIFRYSPREEASPRAKANLMRAILTGQLDPSIFSQEDLKSVADLCVNCHQCRLECPANVEIPHLMTEAKAQYVSVNGLSPSRSLLTRLDFLAKCSKLIRPISNWAIGNRTMRWLLEKTLGVAQGRKLPYVAKRSFVRSAARRRLNQVQNNPGRKVLYFVDTYANYYDTQLAEAFVDVLKHNGTAVYIPHRQTQSAMAMISAGNLDLAKKVALRNISVLAAAVQKGYHIVATEPSAALCLQNEYPMLIDSEEATLVAENTSEACTFLWRLHQQGQLLLDFKPINATLGYHAPCHLRALEVGTPGENLLRLIPQLNVIHQEAGCSGMAGMYGMRKENYRSSLRAGWGLISALRNPQLQAGTTECSSCKIQMEQGTTKPTIHPIKLLALSYGLRPEFEKLLTATGRELIVT